MLGRGRGEVGGRTPPGRVRRVTESQYGVEGSRPRGVKEGNARECWRFLEFARECGGIVRIPREMSRNFENARECARPLTWNSPRMHLSDGGGAAPPSLRCRIFLCENLLCGQFEISDQEFSQDAHSWGGGAAPPSLDPFDVFRLKIEKGDMWPKSEAAG